jgi:hypothetical protein
MAQFIWCCVIDIFLLEWVPYFLGQFARGLVVRPFAYAIQTRVVFIFRFCVGFGKLETKWRLKSDSLRTRWK